MNKLKKSILGIATILLLISWNAQATLTDGLMSHYKFDGISGAVVDDNAMRSNETDWAKISSGINKKRRGERAFCISVPVFPLLKIIVAKEQTIFLEIKT